jgi:hypothetical protein
VPNHAGKEVPAPTDGGSDEPAPVHSADSKPAPPNGGTEEPAPADGGSVAPSSASASRAAATTSLRDAIGTIWASYSSQLTAGGITQAELRRVGEDAVGYAMCEVVRTSLGFAGARDPGNASLTPPLTHPRLIALRRITPDTPPHPTP